jgi:hypothetical protein
MLKKRAEKVLPGCEGVGEDGRSREEKWPKPCMHI